MCNTVHKIAKILALLCLFSGFVESIQVSKSALTQKYQNELKHTEINILVTEWNQGQFADHLSYNLEMIMHELKKYGINVHLLITCDGHLKDYFDCRRAFRDFSYSDEVEIEYQEENLGCSKTRWHQLKYAYDRAAAAKEKDWSSYFFILDGDDIMHSDLILLELLGLLESKKLVAGPLNKLRCYPKDIPEVWQFAHSDVENFEITFQGPFEEFAFNLFDGKILGNIMEKWPQLRLDFVTLEPFREFIRDKDVRIALHEDNTGCPKEVEYFSETENKQALFYYTQHYASLEHSPLISAFDFLQRVTKSRADLHAEEMGYIERGHENRLKDCEERYSIELACAKQVYELDVAHINDKIKYKEELYQTLKTVRIRLGGVDGRMPVCQSKIERYKQQIIEREKQYENEINSLRSEHEKIVDNCNKEYEEAKARLDGRIEEIIKDNKDDQEALLFFFGKPEVSRIFRVNSGQNAAVNKSYLLDKLKYMHQLAHKVLELPVEGPFFEWLTTSLQGGNLLNQDRKKPLSEDFMRKFYGHVFDIIFENAEQR